MSSFQTKYILDSNVFMEASRRYYSFDIAKPFWVGLLRFAEDKLICSIDKVLEEIKKGNDELKAWSTTTFSEHFYSTKNDSSIIQEYSQIVAWAQSEEQYNQIAKDRFMEDDNADTWVIAIARAKDYTIVTHEVFDQNIKKSIPIPNVCESFDIEYCDTFDMLRRMKFSF
jgi:hypothetical protein